MKGRGLRPARVRPAAGLLGMTGVLYLAGRASGAGWVGVLLCALLGLLVLAVGWPAWALAGSEVELVEVPRDATANDPTRVTVTARGRGPGIDLRLILAGGTGEARRAGPGPAGGQLLCIPARRGRADHLVVEVMADGPFGLFQWSRRLRFDLDRPVEIGPAALATGLDPLTAGASAGPQARAATRPGHDLPKGVRAYRSGDSLRLVHWPATARWGQPMVRETEDADPGALVVVADLSGPTDTAETAASLAAGLADEALRAGRAVVLSTSEAGEGRLSPVRSPAEVGRRLARAGTGTPPAPASGTASVRIDAAFASAWLENRRAQAEQTALRRRPRQSLGERLRHVNARQPAEEGVGLRLAAGVAAGTAAAAVLAQGIGNRALQLAVLGGLGVGFVFAWRTRHRPGYGTKTVLALGAIVAFVWFLKTLNGIATGVVADAETPLAELLLVVQVLQSFDATARRDLVFSLYISVPVMAAAGILSVSMALWPYLAVWSLAAMAGLLLAHRRVGLELGALAPEDHGSGPGPAYLHLGTALALSLAAGLGFFLVVPAAGTTQPLIFPAAFRRLVPVAAPGILDNPSLGRANPAGLAAEDRRGRQVAAGPDPFGYFGFSNQLDLATRGRPDDTLVMRVRASRPALWLGQTFDGWNGRTWTISDPRGSALPAGPPITVPLPTQDGFGAATGPDFVQTFYVLQPGPNLIFGADPLSQVYLAGGRVEQLSDGTLRANEELGPGTVYTVVSQPALVTAATLRAADRNPAATPRTVTRRYGTALPTTARVRHLAARVTSAAPTTYDKILALEAWMGRHTRYSLDPPPLPAGADAVDQFLFVSREGFCEQIATSLVVMLRSLHIPSRLDVGYAPGSRNPFTGMYDITASDAHAWAEVWFPGIGWEPFDPTAQVPLSGDAGQSAGSGLQAYLVHGLGAGALPAETGIGAAATAGLLVALGLPVIRRRRARRRAASGPAHAAPSWARLCQERLETWGASRGASRRPSEALEDYLARLGPEGPPSRTGTLIERSAFSASGISAQEASWVEEALADLEAAEPVTAVAGWADGLRGGGG